MSTASTWEPIFKLGKTCGQRRRVVKPTCSRHPQRSRVLRRGRGRPWHLFLEKDIRGV